jgi:hypothetical protein
MIPQARSNIQYFDGALERFLMSNHAENEQIEPKMTLTKKLMKESARN